MPSLHEFGRVQHVSADAVGQPGQRRFRLRAISNHGDYAFMWMEKEQMRALGEAIETVLEDHGGAAATPRGEDPVFPLNANVEVDIRAGQLSLGVKREEGLIVVVGGDGAAEDETSSLSVEFSFPEGSALKQQIDEVVAAGRAPCPLCGAPLDPAGHVCPRSNGHHKLDDE